MKPTFIVTTDTTGIPDWFLREIVDIAILAYSRAHKSFRRSFRVKFCYRKPIPGNTAAWGAETWKSAFNSEHPEQGEFQAVMLKFTNPNYGTVYKTRWSLIVTLTYLTHEFSHIADHHNGRKLDSHRVNYRRRVQEHRAESEALESLRVLYADRNLLRRFDRLAERVRRTKFPTATKAWQAKYA